MPTNTDGVQEQPVSTEQDSARRLAEIRALRYGVSQQEVDYLLAVIDSLTAERDEGQRARASDVLDAEYWMDRCDKAEADVKRLQELARKVLGQISARHSEDHWLCEEAMPVADCDRCELAALSTPPSEGG